MIKSENLAKKINEEVEKIVAEENAIVGDCIAAMIDVIILTKKEDIAAFDLDGKFLIRRLDQKLTENDVSLVYQSELGAVKCGYGKRILHLKPTRK